MSVKHRTDEYARPWLTDRTDAELLALVRQDREWLRVCARSGVRAGRAYRRLLALYRRECRRRGLCVKRRPVG